MTDILYDDTYMTKYMLKFCFSAFVQETGRAGRDGNPAQAIMYINKSDIAQNVQHLTDGMRDYCTTLHCRRFVLMKHLNSTYTPHTILHNCCDNCGKRCKCSDCTDSPDEINNVDKDMNKTTDISKMNMVESFLMSYFEAENACLGVPLAELHTGLGEKLAIELAKEYHKYSDISLLKQHCPVIDDHYLQNICMIITSVINS